MFLTILPIFIQDISLEIIVTTGLAILSFCCYFLARIGIYIPFIIIILLIIVYGIWQYRYNRKFWKKRNRVVPITNAELVEYDEHENEELNQPIDHHEVKRPDPIHRNNFKMKWRMRISQKNNNNDLKSYHNDNERRLLDVADDDDVNSIGVADEKPMHKSFAIETSPLEPSLAKKKSHLFSPIQSSSVQEFSALSLMNDEEKLSVKSEK
jgi:hypothetical protein